MTIPRLFIGFVVLASLAKGAAPAAEPVPRIPLRVGLTIVTAVHAGDGDYESIKRLESADGTALRFRYSSESPHDDAIDVDPNQYQQFRPSPTSPVTLIRTLTVYRNQLRSDLKSSDHYLRVFAPPPGVAETVPGTTAVGVSTAVLNALKTKGAVDLTTYLTAFDAAPLTSADSTADSIVDPRERGTLRRIGKTTVPVIVNGRLVPLPAIHAQGTLGIDESDFYFLDDPDNPLTLRFKIGNESLTVIRIDCPGELETAAPDTGADGGLAIEQSLSATGRADVYGIYFGFNSDVIRPESEPVLKEIAGLLVRHPDWKLNVDGHTDNIGGAAFNLPLSARRAAAVRKALVERYHIAAVRLSTEGYGLSRPKAPNDTLEGRALNRRVELVKQ